MSLFKRLWLLFLSQRGEGEGEGDQGGDSGEGSGEGQGGQDPAAQGQEGQEGQGGYEEGQQGGQQLTAEQYTQLQQELNELRQKHESLTGKTTATERNLAATRKALESSGYTVVQTSDGNMRLVPIPSEKGQSRFSDDQKAKFMSYFPNPESGEGFLNLLNLWAEDQVGTHISKYDQNLTQRQQFQSIQSQSNQRMIELFPSLSSTNKEVYNQPFYDRATEIWMANYKTLPNGELIAANEAAIEMGIAPATIMQAKKEGFQRGKISRSIVGSAQGSQSQGGGGGFKKLSFEEYSKLTPDKKAEYDKKDVLERKG